MHNFDSTMEFIERNYIDYISMSIFTPLPGSEIYQNANKYGKFDDDWHKMTLWTPVFIPFGLSENDLVKYVGRYSRNKTP